MAPAERFILPDFPAAIHGRGPSVGQADHWNPLLYFRMKENGGSGEEAFPYPTAWPLS